MKYSITIKWETKCELWDCLYVFPIPNEIKSIDDLKSYCNYEEKIITAIKPMLHQKVDWNWAIRFEFLCWTDAHYSDDIADFFKEWSFRRIYYKKKDADKEARQRLESVTSKLK